MAARFIASAQTRSVQEQLPVKHTRVASDAQAEAELHGTSSPDALFALCAIVVLGL